MLKNILIKCADILNRNDISKCLKSQNDVEKILDETLKSDIYRLINYFNFTTNTLFENYFNLTFSETLKSDANNIIHYHNFKYTPVKILEVYDEFGNNNVATVLTAHILTNKSRGNFLITYTHIPQELKNLTDEILIPDIFFKTICFGVVSEFFACKNMYKESEFWKNRFLFEIFKLKTKKERRLKSTFSL